MKMIMEAMSILHLAEAYNIMESYLKCAGYNFSNLIINLTLILT